MRVTVFQMQNLLMLLEALKLQPMDRGLHLLSDRQNISYSTM